MSALTAALRLRGEQVTGLVLAVVLAALGAPLGLLAAALTPDVQHAVYAGAGNLLYVGTYPEENKAAVGGDFVLIAVLAGAGVLAGLVTLALLRRAPLGAVLGLLVGGLVAGVVAMAVAHGVVHGDYAGTGATSSQQTFTARPYARGRVDFVVLPAVGLIVFLLANVRWLWRTRAAARTEQDTRETASV